MSNNTSEPTSALFDDAIWEPSCAPWQGNEAMAQPTRGAAEDTDGHVSARRDSAISYHSSIVTESVTSAVFEVVEENGRTYHSYKEGHYLLPNDTAEQNRAFIEHHLFRSTLDGKLFISPVRQLRHVLDIGTGTGLWPFELALKYPSASIIGTDLSPIQPTHVPPNLQFEIDDVEDPWVYTQKFSLIHGRGNLFSFKDPENVVRMATEALEQDGWLEFHDYAIPMRCDDGSWEGTSMQNWNDRMMDALKAAERRLYVEDYAQMFRDAGLANVTEKLFMWPLSPWPQGEGNEQMREWGRQNRRNWIEGLEGVSLAIMTRYGKLSKEEVLQLVQDFKSELWDTRYHVYLPVVVAMGQKV